MPLLGPQPAVILPPVCLIKTQISRHMEVQSRAWSTRSRHCQTACQAHHTRSFFLWDGFCPICHRLGGGAGGCRLCVDAQWWERAAQRSRAAMLGSLQPHTEHVRQQWL